MRSWLFSLLTLFALALGASAALAQDKGTLNPKPLPPLAIEFCSTEDPAPVELSGSGTLWAWTAVTAAPPGYEGEIPYGLGVVELPEGIRVITRLTESDPGALASGQGMELRVVPLHTDDDDNDVVTSAFAPVSP